MSTGDNDKDDGGKDLPPDIVPEPAPGDEPEDEVEKSRAPLLSHLIELRRRLIVSICAIGIGFVVCFAFSQQLYDLLTVPFIDAYRDRFPDQPAVFNYKPLELFFARIKLSLMAGLMLSFPVIARELYLFVAPGLYRNEKRAVYPFLIAIPFLFLAGLALVYYLVMPFVINFALSMQQLPADTGGVAYNLFIFVGDYLALITTLCLAFGFAFQLPVILTLLAIAGILDDKALVRSRRYAIVGIFLAAAFLTPPDPISQIIMGGVLMALYEISIIAVRFAGRRERTEEAAAE